MLAAALSLALAASFPLPSVDQKAVAAAPEQKVFRLPSRFEKVRDFYLAQFKDQAEVTVKAQTTAGKRTLVLTSKRAGDTWRRAVVTEGSMETTVEVTPVLRLESERVSGSGKPLVEMILPRSPEVQKALESIDASPKR